MIAPAEEWRPVPGYEQRYEVSSLGRVRSLVRQRIIGQYPNKKGYLRAQLYRGTGRPCYRPVHAMVLVAFVGPRPDGFETAHADGDKANNALSNLKWATSLENSADKRRHGTICFGEANGSARATTATVLRVRRLSREGLGYKSIARMVGLAGTTVRNIISGKRWSHVPTKAPRE